MSTTFERDEEAEWDALPLDDPRRKLTPERFRELRAQATKTRDDYYSTPEPEQPTDADIDASWGFTPTMTPEERRALIRQRADDDEIEEDPELAERTKWEIRALREEEDLVAELSRKSLTSLPREVRKLVRQFPNNMKLRALYDRLATELYERTDETLKAGLLDAVDTMLDVMENGEDAQRLKAATYVFERLRGKTPEIVQVSADKPFQVVLERLVTGPRRARAALEAAEGEEVLDAEVISGEAHTGPPEAQKAEKADNGSRTGEDLFGEERAMMREWS